MLQTTNESWSLNKGQYLFFMKSIVQHWFVIQWSLVGLSGWSICMLVDNSLPLVVVLTNCSFTCCIVVLTTSFTFVVVLLDNNGFRVVVVRLQQNG